MIAFSTGTPSIPATYLKARQIQFCKTTSSKWLMPYDKLN